MHNNELVTDTLQIEYQESFGDIKLRPHFHNTYEIIFILEGEIELKINDKLYNANENCIIFINNFESHELKVMRYPYKRYFLLIKPDYFQTVLNAPVLSSVFKNRPDDFNHIINLSATDSLKISSHLVFMHEISINKEAFKEISLRSHLCLIFTYLYKNYVSSFPLVSLNKSTEMIIEIQKYIEGHFLEDLTLTMLAKQFYTNMYYLSHLFKKVIGFTFKEYLIRQRIAKAKEFLFYSNDNVTQVAINSGFYNVNHFIRIFKKFEGITPYQYRKKLRE